MQVADFIVVLVEASNTQRKIIKAHLSKLGVNQVHTTETATAALALMENHRPDLVISALYLPDMTGTELVHEMRTHPSLKDVAFMLISSETDIRVLDPIRQAGSIAILPKPFESADLKRALVATQQYYTTDEIQLDSYEPGSLEVLVVDDSRLARNHIKRVLRNMGMEKITEAENGAEAAKLVKDQFFDLVVTDYNMPEMDGQQLVSYIRNSSAQASIPILMVTSESDEQRLASVQQSGVSAICDKPFETETVRQLLQFMLSDNTDS